MPKRRPRLSSLRLLGDHKVALYWKAHVRQGDNKDTLPDAWKVIADLRAPHKWGIYASQGAWYSQSIFGRDSLLVGRMLVSYDRELAVDVIITICSLQGLQDDISTQEQPGRIHHEYRNLSKWQADRPGKLLAQLASLLWGGNTKEMLTYFSTDSTALFLQLVADYCSLYGGEILNQTVLHHTGHATTVGASVQSAAHWLMHRAKGSGYVEHRRTNPWSVVNQTWKDSPTAYIHTDGGLPNMRQPVTYLLAQVLAADGLEAIAPWMSSFPECDTDSWIGASQRMRHKTLGEMWMPSLNYFSPMLDRDNHQQHRPIATLTSDASWMLASGIFDHLAVGERRPYLEGIISLLFSDDFLTPVGIRSRAKRHHQLISFADYHGSWTVWSLDSYFFALGLRKQGYYQLAGEIELRMLGAYTAAGLYYEYFLVSPDNVVQYRPHKTAARGAETINIQISPEPNLAWSAADAIRMTDVHRHLPPTTPQPAWKQRFEAHILDSLPYSLVRGDSPPPQTTMTPFRVSTTRGWAQLAFNIAPQLAKQYITPRDQTA